MTIETTAPVTVLYAERTVRIPDIAPLSLTLCPELTQDAVRRGLSVTGPWIFVSHGLPGDGETRFTVEFCLPVSPADAAAGGGFPIRTLPALTCATRRFRGPTGALFSDGYGPLLRQIREAGHVPGGESREIYHRWTGPDSEDNEIELQFSIR